ncbi:MAG: ExeA family protein [Sandaracinaceae bacterium]|nr:ExeA family protein [Sandaracinaceae bacterium]
MYCRHFAMTRLPFDKRLMQDELFESEALSEVSVRIKHLLDMRGIGLVTGESGSGKTTSCRSIVSTLNTGLYRVVYVTLTTGNVMDLYKTIAWELGLTAERNRAGLFRSIRDEVSRLCHENRLRPVLIVDEAHHLRTDVLEDLRLLTNYAMDSDNRLCIQLVGHPELRRRLNMAALDALAQRIVVRAHMRGLSRAETTAYFEHHLRLAGCNHPVFEAPAIEAIYQATSGLPRRTNLLAHHALLAAAVAKASNVTTEHVHAALDELA